MANANFITDGVYTSSNSLLVMSNSLCESVDCISFNIIS